MSSTNEEKGAQRRWVLGMLAGVLILAYAGVSLYFKWHFYPNTVIGDKDVAFRTEKETAALLKREIGTYTLNIKEREGVKETISGKDLDMEPDFAVSLAASLGQQTGVAWPVHFFTKQEIEKQAVKYDEGKLQGIIKNLQCMSESKQVAPKDAYLEYRKENKCYEIVPEVMGTALDVSKVEELIRKSVRVMDETLDLEKEQCYQNPEVYAQDALLVKTRDTANGYLKTSVTYDDGNTQLCFDADTIRKMLIFKNDGDVRLKKSAIAKFAQKVDHTYSTLWQKRSFKTSYGASVTISRGDYGWKVNREKEEKALKKAIKNQTVEVREPYFTKKAASHGTQDYGGSYVEINLTAQHLFVYHKGNKVFETDFVSGNTSRGNGTRLGINSLKYKEKNAVLRGDDYETPVSFWMPFDGNIGMHDATWRSRFGGDVYKTSGSHGCINLPLHSAETIFSYVTPGEAIVVYELPGTEPKSQEEKDKDKDKEKDKKKKTA